MTPRAGEWRVHALKRWWDFIALRKQRMLTTGPYNQKIAWYRFYARHAISSLVEYSHSFAQVSRRSMMLHNALKSDATLLLGLLLMLFGTFAWQINGEFSIAVADEVAFVTSGVNLIRHGHFTNAFGETETWFPPVYPAAIGLASLGGAIDAHLVARLLSLLCGMINVICTFFIAKTFSTNRVIPVLAAVLLALNPTFQLFSFAAMSEAMNLTFVLTAFYCWLRTDQSPHVRWTITGMLLALATLTRPESILLLPLLAALDIVAARSRTVLVSTSLGMATFGLIVFPYAIFLYGETGRLTITNKGQVNVAAGRSHYYNIPREYIDPDTLEMGFFPFSPTIGQELRRYGANCFKLLLGVARIYRAGFVLIPVMFFCGVVFLVRSQKFRFLAGIAAHFGYLVVVPLYDVAGEKNLHAVIPALCLFIASGANAFIEGLCATELRWRSVSAGVCLVILGVILAEGGTRVIRWHGVSQGTQNGLLREAGRALADVSGGDGVVYEIGATVGYYAGLRRGRLTPNDMKTFTRYVEYREPGDCPVYLALLASKHLHPSFIRLAMGDHHTSWQPVLRVEDQAGVVAVFRFRRADGTTIPSGSE